MNKNQNVLLVDNDEDDLILLTEALQECVVFDKYNFAYNGREALDYLKNTSVLPELIFLDINMHIMNGIEFLSIIKSDLLFKKIPVIILSTSTNPHEIEQTLRLGAKSYISKPDNYEDLKSILMKLLHEFRFPD